MTTQELNDMIFQIRTFAGGLPKPSGTADFMEQIAEMLERWQEEALMHPQKGPVMSTEDPEL